jgi:hypothetical protein
MLMNNNCHASHGMKRNYLQNKENLTSVMKRELVSRSFKDNLGGISAYLSMDFNRFQGSNWL